MKKPISPMLTLLLSLLLIFLSGCQPSPAAPAVTLQVFAAASLTEAFNELGRDFARQQRGVQVQFNFAGSQQLVQQLQQGVQADVFASANLSQMRLVVEQGLVISETVQVFASNQLAVALAPGNPAGIEDLAHLSQPGVRLVLAAPEAPAGIYTQELLLRLAGYPTFGPWYREAVLDNVVSYETNVKAVLEKVQLGEADAGILYASDVQGKDAPQLESFIVPPEVNPRIRYPIAPLVGAAQPELAQVFIDFVLSEQGQKVLAEHGLLPPPAP
jgi:molybdate transport system substrate-binding protein